MLKPNRSEQLMFRVTPAERKSIEKAAERHESRTVTEYVREAVLRQVRSAEAAQERR